MFKKILVPVDGSEGSWRALDTAVELGKKVWRRTACNQCNPTI